MQHTTQNLSSDRKIISGGVRPLWRRGFLCHGNDQTIRFMQHVRKKLVLSVVLIVPGPATFLLRSEVSPLQPQILNPGVA